MKRKYRKYVDQVNAQYAPWHKKIGRRKWITTRPMIVQSRLIPAGTETDLFSCVPDTQYIRFHVASLGHDLDRADPKVPRTLADARFLFEMVYAIRDIYAAFLKTDCPEKVVNKEIFRLCRVASLYMLGVSGKVGTAYLWLSKLF